MALDAFSQRRSGETRDPQPRIVKLRLPGLFRERYPNFRWILRRQFVKPQRSQQAEDAAGHALGDLCKRVLSRERVLICDVDTARLSLDKALTNQAVKLPAGDSAGFKINWPHKAYPPDGLENLILPCRCHGESIIQNVGE